MTREIRRSRDPVPFGRVGIIPEAHITRDTSPGSGVRSIYDAVVIDGVLVVVQHNYHEIESFHGAEDILEAAGEGTTSYWVAYDGSVIPSRHVSNFWRVNSMLHRIYIEQERSRDIHRSILDSVDLAEARDLADVLRAQSPTIEHF